MTTHKSFEHWLQSRLTAHGFATGGIDGEVGPITIAALAAFQRAKGLLPTGQADEATVAALRQSSSALARPFNRPPDHGVMPEPMQAQRFPRQSNVAAFYGPVGQNQVLVPVPWRMKLAWDKRRTIARMSLHEKVAESAGRAFERINAALGQEGIERLGLDLFGGSLNVRRMRGSSVYSMHSWGIAIDFDPERNRLRWSHPQARLSRDDAQRFWDIWEDEGWTSLGRERDFDWMHVQAARL